MKYQILEETKKKTFETKLEKCLNEGWQLCGGLKVEMEHSLEDFCPAYYIQALILLDPPKTVTVADVKKEMKNIKKK